MADRIGKDYQRVMILSVYHNAFLCATDETRDEEQREVIVGKSAELCGLNEWRLFPEGGGFQRATIYNKSQIVHHQFNEPLFAGVDDLAFDDERRTVLTWIPGKQQDVQSSWEFLRGPEGHYLIKNVEFGEYLYASDQSAKGRVFTWRKSRDSLNRQCYWDIINVN